jgi:hypothetical protein
MPIFAPTITNYPNGVVTVVSNDATPYSSIIQSMGSFMYEISEMYLNANNNSQILQAYQFNTYDVNGTLQSFVDIPTIDPYQFQSSLFFKLAKGNVVLNGRTNLDFEVLPSESLYIIMYTKQLANRDLVPRTNFFNNDFFNLFNDYKDEI